MRNTISNRVSEQSSPLKNAASHSKSVNDDNKQDSAKIAAIVIKPKINVKDQMHQ